MRRWNKGHLRLAMLGACLAALLAFSLACAGPEATPTPQPTRMPVAQASPTLVPAPTMAPSPPTPAPLAAPQPRQGGTLRFPLTVSIDAPDPAFSTLTGTRRVMYLLYDGLVQIKPDGAIAPELAQSWDISADGKSVTFKLQRGVKFHDGTDLGARAVKWNYDRFLDPKVSSPRRSELSPPLKQVTVVDDYTVRFEMDYPFRPLLANLTQQAGHMVSPEAVERYKSYADRSGEFGRRPVGAGPFKLQEWAVGTRFLLVRNEVYWQKGFPYVDAIQMPIIGDSQVQFAMLRTGEVDVMEEVRSEDMGIVERNPALKVVELKGVATMAVWIRNSVKPWDNKALRQALAYAVDRKAFADVVFGGRAVPAQSVVGLADGQWHDPTIQLYDYSLQKTRAKLAEAGYPGGFSFSMPCRMTGRDGRTCEVLQAMWANAGIDMRIEPYDYVNYFADFVAKKQQGPIASSFSPRPDPAILIRRLYHTKGSQNIQDYKNPEADRLMEEAEAVYDTAKAKEIYRRLLTMIGEDAPTVYIVWWNNLTGLRENVQGFADVVDRVPRLRGLWFSR